MTVGQKLHDFRKSLGMNQKQMSSGIVSKATLSRIERGENSIAANDLVKILVRQNVSIVDFLQEYSEIDVGIRSYQNYAMKLFKEKNLRGLEQLKNQLPIEQGILRYVVCDMALVVEGKSPKYESQIYALLSKVNEFNEPLLWCLLASLKLYSKKDWSLVVDKAIESRKRQETSRKATKLLLEITVTFLSKKRDDFIKDEAVMFLQQLLVSRKEKKRIE